MATINEVLVNQVQGIMDSTDMVGICMLYKFRRLYRLHKTRLNRLCEIHCETNSWVIKNTNRIIPVNGEFEKFIDTEVTFEDRELWLRKMFEVWIQWGNAAVAIYSSLVENDKTNAKMWNKLYKIHLSDLNAAKHFQKRLSLDTPSEPSQTVKQKIRTKVDTIKQTSE